MPLWRQRSHFGYVWSHLVLFSLHGSHDAGLPLRLLAFAFLMIGQSGSSTRYMQCTC